jgi:hypothetical protein
MKDNILTFILLLLVLGMLLMIVSWVLFPSTLQLNNIAAFLGMIFLAKHIWG